MCLLICKQIKMCYKRNLKVGCLAGFWHHSVTTTSAHTHAYCYPLLKVDQKQVRNLAIDYLAQECHL